ncbi:reverse transcriptase domain-containing protein [Tanacetum coccineum]
MQATMSNQTNELKNMMASFFQMNIASSSGSGSLPSNTIANPKGELKAITTRSCIVLDGPSVPMLSPFINPDEDERVEETLTDSELVEYTIMVPPPFVASSINLCTLGLEKFLVYQTISTRMTLELANRSVCTPAGIARDVFVPVGRFMFPADFVIVDYESDHRVPLILGRPFLRTARDLIDVHREELILCDEPNHALPILTSPKVKDDIFDPEGDNVLIEKLLNLYSTKDIPPNVNPLSGSITSSYPSLATSEISDYSLEEFVDELADY